MSYPPASVAFDGNPRSSPSVWMAAETGMNRAATLFEEGTEGPRARIRPEGKDVKRHVGRQIQGGVRPEPSTTE